MLRKNKLMKTNRVYNVLKFEEEAKYNDKIIQSNPTQRKYPGLKI